MINKVGHLIETLSNAAKENGIDPFCEVTVRLGEEGREVGIDCLKVKATALGLRLIIQTDSVQ